MQPVEPDMDSVHAVARSFFPEAEVMSGHPLGEGLINRTYLVKFTVQRLKPVILQRINPQVFPKAGLIQENMLKVGDRLETHQYRFAFPRPLRHPNGSYQFYHDGAYWRILPYYPDTYAPSAVRDPEMAYRAGQCIGHFHASTVGFDASALHEILPGFHSGAQRLMELDAARKHPVVKVDGPTAQMLKTLLENRDILSEFDLKKAAHPQRVIHHDTKISNFLFSRSTNEVHALIDLDTLMPGTIMSDIGDMIRSFSAPEGESVDPVEDAIPDKRMITALVDGYLDEMGGKLTGPEKENLFFSGIAMACMQAVRFMTDHLNGDRYYRVEKKGENLLQAKNQLRLFQWLSTAYPSG